jgi:hypothetical protein
VSAICLQEFREKDAAVIEIPNIGYDTFTAMMRYIYVGTVDVQQDQAMPLLQVRRAAASDQQLCRTACAGQLLQMAVSAICQVAALPVLPRMQKAV